MERLDSILNPAVCVGAQDYFEIFAVFQPGHFAIAAQQLLKMQASIVRLAEAFLDIGQIPKVLPGRPALIVSSGQEEIREESRSGSSFLKVRGEAAGEDFTF